MEEFYLEVKEFKRIYKKNIKQDIKIPNSLIKDIQNVYTSYDRINLIKNLTNKWTDIFENFISKSTKEAKLYYTDWTDEGNNIYDLIFL